MRKASTALLEPGTQTPSPAPDLIPAENLTRNSHSDWYNKRGHVKDPLKVEELLNLLHAVLKEDQEEIRMRMALLAKKYADVIGESKAAD